MPPLTQYQQGTPIYWRCSTVPRAEGISRAAPLASWDFADRLRCIGVKADSVLPGDRADFRDRLDGADFVVGMHDAHQHRARRDRSANIVGTDPAGVINGR